MKIGLIAMSGVRVKTAELAALGVTLPGFVRRGKVIASLPSLGLLTVAGATPDRHEVQYLEVDQLDETAALPAFDLVGISSFTAMIEDAYRLADRYRAQGTPVVLGGIHVSLMPAEALEHADAILTAGAESAWPRLLEDLEAGRLQRRYDGLRSQVFAPQHYVQPRFELLQGRPYNRVTVQTSRGCPRACEFCAASLRITDGFNQKPVAAVIAEIRAARQYFPEPFFEFADDNTFLNRPWSRELLKALQREDLHFFTETDASVADDPELCDLLADAGCRQVLIGFESPRVQDLGGLDPVDWKRQCVPHIRRTVDRLQSRGVSVNGCFILGLDHQTPAVFEELLAFVKQSGLAEVQFTVQTPFPGTPLYARLKREGRLFTERFWERCTLFDVNYVPKNMSVEALEGGMRWLFQETYNRRETAERLRGFVRQSQAHRAARQGRRPGMGFGSAGLGELDAATFDAAEHWTDLAG